MREPTGIGIGSGMIGVCDSDSLYFFKLDGTLVARFSGNDILGTNIKHFSDVSINGDKVYILTGRRVVVARANF